MRIFLKKQKNVKQKDFFFFLQIIAKHQQLQSDLFHWQRSLLLFDTRICTHTSWVNDPRANIYCPLTLNFASILLNCSLVRSAIIQTGNANVNEFKFAYLYFPMVEMSLFMTLYNEECHSWWPPDMLLVIMRPKKSNWWGWKGNK